MNVQEARYFYTAESSVLAEEGIYLTPCVWGTTLSKVSDWAGGPPTPIFAPSEKAGAFDVCLHVSLTGWSQADVTS